ncbi:chromosome partitioning protein ParB [Edwardsiella piscicida]|nr:chromosome partitioning protein ParB [Edwardsiella piscicida]ELV7536830.1 chromosome partitioning protein ParB [Edwardsiella piscicida]
MANSFKKMCKKGGPISRRDSGMLIKLDDIHVQEGFNKRVDDERTQQADEDLFQFLFSGGTVPPLEVRPRDEGGVWVVEGHRRIRAYRRVREAGKPIELIAIAPFTGSDVERVARIMTSNNQLPLTQFEQSLVVKELAAFNLTPDEIAKLIHKSRATVDKLLILSASNYDVQQLVKDGEVAMDVAVDRVKEHGESAGDVLQEDVKRAKAQGKKKVTRSVTGSQFSATRARRLVELLSDAEIDGDGRTLVLREGIGSEVMGILNDYMKSAGV